MVVPWPTRMIRPLGRLAEATLSKRLSAKAAAIATGPSELAALGLAPWPLLERAVRPPTFRLARVLPELRCELACPSALPPSLSLPPALAVEVAALDEPSLEIIESEPVTFKSRRVVARVCTFTLASARTPAIATDPELTESPLACVSCVPR